jgi:hypothetical protein
VEARLWLVQLGPIVRPLPSLGLVQPATVASTFLLHRTAPPSSKIPPIQDKRLLSELFVTPVLFLYTFVPPVPPTTNGRRPIPRRRRRRRRRTEPPHRPGLYCSSCYCRAAGTNAFAALRNRASKHARTHTHTQTHGIRGSCFFRPSGLRCPFLGSPASHSMCPVVRQPTSSGR